MEMIAKCTKLKVLTLGWYLVLAPLKLPTGKHEKIGTPTFSSQSFLNVLNKSSSLQNLSLYQVQLSDMVSPP